MVPGTFRAWAICASLSLPGAIVAQLSRTSQMAGWTILSPSAPGEVHLQDVKNGCLTAKTLCQGVLKASQFPGGGTAYDPRHSAFWLSDGVTVEFRDRSCLLRCSFPAQLMDSRAVVSGLAIAVAAQRLYQLESRLGYAGIRSYDITRCPPTPLNDGCTFTIQSNATAGGLAYDEVRDLLYFTESAPAWVGFLSVLHVAKASDKCNSTKISLRGCQQGAQGWGPVSGAAYDPASRQLYATDGRRTEVVAMTDPLNGRTSHVSCCDKGTPGDYAGLAVIPGWTQQKTGQSCLAKGCASCPQMSWRLVGGDPSLGNPSFGFLIQNGPGGSFALTVLGGACTAGLQLPMLCGPFYVPLAPLPILSTPVQLSDRDCGGMASVALPIPALEALCGLRLCGQWLVLCGATLGTTEAIEFTIGS